MFAADNQSPVRRVTLNHQPLTQKLNEELRTTVGTTVCLLLMCESQAIPHDNWRMFVLADRVGSFETTEFRCLHLSHEIVALRR